MAATSFDPAHDFQTRTNVSTWAQGNFVKHYAGRGLRPVETMLLVEYREAFAGRVLELGCGAGRLTGYLIDLSESVCGIDIAPAMVAHCRETYPRGTFSLGDLRDLSRFEDASRDVVLAANNVLDILGDAERRRVLREILRVLSPGGLLVMSSHNRAFVPKLGKPTDIRGRNPVRSAGKLVLMPWRVRNRRRLLPYERVEDGYAVVNDDAHHFRLLHYYIARDDQERQLGEAGFELLECRDTEGHTVARGESAPDCAELHYVARRRADGGAVSANAR